MSISSQKQAPVRWLAGAVLTVLLSLMGAAAHSRTPMHFERLGITDGLSQQSANAIAQDAAGFIWIGTEDGLNRYNGYSIEHVRRVRAEKEGLPNNYIADVQVDADGRLWVATDGGGLARQSGSGIGFGTVPAAVAKGLERIRVIRFDASGQLWIGAREGGLAMLDVSRSKLTRWRHDPTQPNSLASDVIIALLESRRGDLWIGTDRGLNRLSADRKGIRHIRLRSIEGSQPVKVRALLEDREGALWIGTDAGLVRLDPETGAERRYRHEASSAKSLPSDLINVLHQDEAGRLWIGTPHGLSLLDPASGHFDTYQHDPADAFSLPDSNVVSLVEDRGGLLWIGTKFGGLGRWNPRTWSFGAHAGGSQQGLGNSNVMAFTEDGTADGRSRLWISTFDGGITVIDRTSGQTTRLLHDPADSRGLSDNRVMTLMTDSHGEVWAGTMSGGLNRIDPRTLRVTAYRHDPANPLTLSAPGVMSLLEDSVGNVWVGTFGGGLSRFNRASQTFDRYLPDPDVSTRLASGRVTALLQDRAARIWVGTDGGGLHILDPTTGLFHRLQHDGRDTSSLSDDTVYALHADANGTIWVGTRGGGLDKVVGSSTAPASVRFVNIAEAEGLPNSTVYGIQSDSAGSLWLSTNYGLARLDPRTGAIRAFHRRNGLQAEEFNFGAHYRSRRGELLFGSSNGYNAFHPERLEWNNTPPSIVLSAHLETGESFETSAVSPQSHPIRLAYRHNGIAFDFAALDFASPQANAFQYQLEGFKPDWVDVGTQHRLTYSSLPAGHYTLHVRAANADGVWTRSAAAFTFDVDPAPWATRSAYAFYVFSVLLIAWGCWVAHRRSIAREEKYARQLEASVRDRTRELAERNAELVHVNERLETASLSDPLTGLGNRRSLMQAIPGLISKVGADVAGAGSLVFMLVDLDRLKPVNDEHGHEAGDKLITGVSALLLNCVRETDKVVRWGGDEFVIVGAPMDFKGAAIVAERIRAAIARTRFAVGRGQFVRTTCSIGFAPYPFVPGNPGQLTWEHVLNLADMAAYRAKKKRNSWIGWRGTPEAASLTDIVGTIERNADAALRDGLLEMRSGDETTESKLANRRG
jgi:diguanylate cyclase (GGDEF)-like protein